jgi:hypothetical protein
VEITEFFERSKLLNLPDLRSKRSDWTDRLPLLPERPSKITMDLVKGHWSFWLPAAVRDGYMLWLAGRRYRLNLEQIEIEELDDLCSVVDADTPEQTRSVYDRHATRRLAARFMVASRERRRLERLARRWDIDAPPMIVRGEAHEDVITRVRRAIREARWTFIERCAKIAIPILSLIVAILALLSKR